MDYIFKPMSYVLVIMLGYLLKRAGFFGKDDHRLMSKIMVNITLPCTIIQAFDGFERDAKMFIIVGIGFICAFMPILLMYLTTGRVEKRLRAYRMLNIGGYNIGCFSLPLVQAFFGNTGVVAACMFDTGNAIMMTGGAYAMTSTLLKTGGEQRESVGDILMKFVKSLPFDAYMLMILLAALDVKLPSAVFTLTRPAGQANAFIAMMMIGMMFEPAGDKALLRAIATVASDITGMVQDGTGGASAVLDAAEQKIYAVRRGRSAQNMEQISVVLQGVLDHLAELSATGGKTLPGLSTGLSAVDDKINGLSKSDLILLAARPGMGKTSFALNVALNVAKASGKAVAVFSLEMSKEQLVTRVLSNEALVENGRLISGNLRESDWVKIAEAASTLSRTDIKIDDNPLLTVADMNAKCRRIENLGLVVIDYLQLMTSAGGKGYSGENRQQAVSDISRMLKIMAKELQVPVLCLSQLSRANEKRDDKRPMLSDLRESGAIEQDADIVLFLYRDDYYNEDSEKHNIAECIVAKNRHGETGKVELRWMPEYTTFGTLERRYEDE